MVPGAQNFQAKIHLAKWHRGKSPSNQLSIFRGKIISVILGFPRGSPGPKTSKPFKHLAKWHRVHQQLWWLFRNGNQGIGHHQGLGPLEKTPQNLDEWMGPTMMGLGKMYIICIYIYMYGDMGVYIYVHIYIYDICMCFI